MTDVLLLIKCQLEERKCRAFQVPANLLEKDDLLLVEKGVLKFNGKYKSETGCPECGERVSVTRTGSAADPSYTYFCRNCEPWEDREIQPADVELLDFNYRSFMLLLNDATISSPYLDEATKCVSTLSAINSHDDNATPTNTRKEPDTSIIAAIVNAKDEIIEKCGRPSYQFDEKDIFEDRAAAERFTHEIGEALKKRRKELGLFGRFAVAEYIMKEAKPGDALFAECAKIREVAKHWGWLKISTIRQKVEGQRRTTEKTLSRRTKIEKKKRLVRESLKPVKKGNGR